MKRESGFYWVKSRGEWTIGQYDNRNNIWFLIGSEVCYHDNDLDEIIEKRIIKE